MAPAYEPKRGIVGHTAIEITPDDPQYEKSIMWLPPKDIPKAERIAKKARRAQAIRFAETTSRAKG
ncbi:MAG: hypothetical protein HY706_14565 [Candidatus Hydrogenedentes bacterium]|nr:hypothetical protein [Candidatus Hydrogenedentota bacterium]